MAEPVERPSTEPSGGPGGSLAARLGVRGPVNNWQFTAVSAVAGLALAAGAVLAAGPWDSGQRKAERDRATAAARTGGVHHAKDPEGPAPAPSAPAVLDALGTGGTVTRDAPAGATRDLSAVLDPLMGNDALGTRRAAVVIDTATGKRLYGKGADAPMTPASTVKIATTVAALDALGPAHRIPTTVRASADLRTVTLVGGGDPTLSEADLRALATETARALKAGKTRSVHLRYDTSRYTGPSHHPIGPNENIAPMSALMVDEGRRDDSTKGPAPRTEDPAGDAARTFAGLLDDAGIDTKGAPAHGRPAKGSHTVATHLSAPLSGLVERALTNSDNDIAEALARQTAIAAGQRADFAGGRRAVTARLKKLGLPLKGVNIADGSGLDRRDKVTAALLAGLLARAADPGHPELRPVLTGLPVAGFTGTLSRRYTTEDGGTGFIRAKTGTLTGVNSLAGTVVDTRGRLLAFAFLASGTTAPAEAQKALDELATALGAGRR
ncbi:MULTISPECIES: D-alanyl-D-alanine carboxypeptidase/D-alanyl-D-alanine endopeptidase [unclassified Streptomyces]|uniref:D-alanyl-D-alanine carboxypeptidase/D-alanyl-D-alanine endopeptidase n=1 Tax=unclassified Streptomyces TaxID=2593676 RepID=UPI000DAEE435|nr:MULTISPECIES: D-alanyl-D-alanine carboxypeptidase/D-alanyl-D-alanine-endopeptidase [unclassified Streptomyces]PZT72545.1 D-alanyl-D-alanine carboxypeptidase/D-alanyl-D-alanine-endopeptidase [Streptomyces sp. AC1-42T]PZT81138.1 D-alanyl-D-alanine carboxypeptidase/D-alanyl-D-alanine-endopeptidase [Streptomyces sp. AC1-42W]